MFSFLIEISSDVQIQKHLTSVRIEEWLREDLFHLQWWFLIALFIFSLIIWWKLIDKKNLLQLGIYTVYIIIIVLLLDEIGEELTLWDYPTAVMPFFPPLEAVNMSSLPMIYSLIFQYCKTWKSFIIASVLMSGIFCFLLEPVLIWMKIYQLITWKSYYGFPIYIAIGIGGKAIITILQTISTKHNF